MKELENVDKTPLVVIQCTAYNHESYIREALDGFVMQQTDFPFVAIVHDDASSDGTAAIIQEYAEKYPDIIKPIYETENQYSKKNGSLTRIMHNACEATGAKYIAICEGDDYWTDPLKLQKQVDFLEAHPDYGAVYCKVNVFNQVRNRFENEFGGYNESLDSLFVANNIPTMSVLFRLSLLSEYKDFLGEKRGSWPMGDYPLWLYIAFVSKIKFIEDLVGVYRVLEESASHSNSKLRRFHFGASSLELRLWFAKKTAYDITHSKRVQQWQNMLDELRIRIFLTENKYEEAHNYIQKIKSTGTRSFYSRRLLYLMRFPRVVNILLNIVDSWISR